MVLEDLKGLKYMLKYELCKVSPRWSKLPRAIHMQPWAFDCVVTTQLHNQFLLILFLTKDNNFAVLKHITDHTQCWASTKNSQYISVLKI